MIAVVLVSYDSQPLKFRQRVEDAARGDALRRKPELQLHERSCSCQQRYSAGLGDGWTALPVEPRQPVQVRTRRDTPC